ncbi:MAG TPA: hypothetical protein VFB46_06085 [Gemmatimonadaceae bacterium]|nr:hypothetical protein [Gemmatimonadaceae bacterium]
MRITFAKVLTVLAGAVLVYIAWQWSSAPRAAQGAPIDTMCIASRIGLPCAP